MRGLAVALLALASCAPWAGPPSPAARSPVPPSTPAQPLSARERTDCARDVVGAFVDAFDRADARALETFFSLDRGVQPFTWFVTPTTPAYGPSRADLPRYLAAARAAGRGPSWHGGVDFEMEFERALPERTTVHIGKGAVDCVARTIFVFVLGDAIEPRQGSAR